MIGDGDKDGNGVIGDGDFVDSTGWCLEWLHPPPKGFNIGEGERERDDEREKSFLPSFIPDKRVK